MGTAASLVAGEAVADSVLAADPRDAAALEARGALKYARVTAGLVTDAAAAKDTVDAAERDLRAATRLDPHRAGAWVTLSRGAYRRYDRVDANLSARRAYEEDAYLAQAPDVLWRLFITSYDLEQAAPAQSWCATGA